MHDIGTIYSPNVGMWAGIIVGCSVAWELFLCLYGDVQQMQTCLCSPFILIYNAKLP